jgi:hypothetical protein
MESSDRDRFREGNQCSPCRVERRWLRRRLATNSSKARFNTGFVTGLVIGTTGKSGTHTLHRAPNVGWNCLRTVRQREITKLPTRGTVPIRTLGWPHFGIRIAVLLGAALIVAPAPVLAETQVSGTPKAVRIEARDAPLEEILAALNSAFGVHYQLSVNLDKRLTGTYEGFLPQVLARILNGYRFGLYKDNGAMAVIVAGPPQLMPTTAALQPRPSTAALQPRPSTAALQPMPSTAAPQPMPSTAAPQPMPSTAAPQPRPSMAVPQLMPSTAAPQPMPSTVAPQPIPSTVAPQPIPSTAASQPIPSTAASQPRPATAASQPKQSRAASQPRPSRATSQSRPSTATSQPRSTSLHP